MNYNKFLNNIIFKIQSRYIVNLKQERTKTMKKTVYKIGNKPETLEQERNRLIKEVNEKQGRIDDLNNEIIRLKRKVKSNHIYEDARGNETTFLTSFVDVMFLRFPPNTKERSKYLTEFDERKKAYDELDKLKARNLWQRIFRKGE